MRQVSTGQPGWRKSRWEIADQGVAAPARPDLGEGDGREHPHGDVFPFGVMEGEAGRRHGERAPPARCTCSCSGSRGAQRRGGRSAPPSRYPAMSGLVSSAASDSSASGSSRRVCAPAEAQRPLQCPAKRAERGLRSRAGTARKTGGDEHPVVRQREGRPTRMQPPPAAGGEQVAAPLAHPRQRAPGIAAGLRPGPARRAEARARPVDHLDRAALGRGVGERAGERPQDLGVDAREGRQLDDEPHRPRVDVELARLIEGAPGQQGMERGRHGRRCPRPRRLLALEEFEQTPDRGLAHRAHFTLQPAGSSTTRTCDASR